MIKVFNRNEIANGSLQKLLKADDFYYDFTRDVILSSANPNFLINYEDHSHDPERPRGKSFLFRVDGFDINFHNNYCYDLDETVRFNEEYNQFGFMTVPIRYIGSSSSPQLTYIRKNPNPKKSQLDYYQHSLEMEKIGALPKGFATMGDISEYEFESYSDRAVIRSNKFNSVFEQKLIIEIFKKAMLAFPASFALEATHGYKASRKTYIQDERLGDCPYGVQIKFSKEVEQKIGNGNYIINNGEQNVDANNVLVVYDLEGNGNELVADFKTGKWFEFGTRNNVQLSRKDYKIIMDSIMADEKLVNIIVDRWHLHLEYRYRPDYWLWQWGWSYLKEYFVPHLIDFVEPDLMHYFIPIISDQIFLLCASVEQKRRFEIFNIHYLDPNYNIFS